MNLFDRITDGHPRIYSFAEKRLNAAFRTSLGSNICFTAAASFACGFCSMSGGTIGFIYPAVFCMMLLSWIYSSALAGFLKQWLYLFYSTAFWMLPLLFIETAAESVNGEGATAFKQILVRVSELVTVASFKLFSDIPFGASVCMAASSAILFLIGFFIRRNAHGSRSYCKMRLKYIQDFPE